MGSSKKFHYELKHNDPSVKHELLIVGTQLIKR
jgi:hypothetical protein